MNAVLFLTLLRRRGHRVTVERGPDAVRLTVDGETWSGTNLGLLCVQVRESLCRRHDQPGLNERAQVARDVERLGLRGAIDGLREGRR